jgi:hypothetical protein
MKDLEQQLIDFVKYIKEVHTDQYGQLQICDDGDELDPTVEKVVKDYLKTIEEPKQETLEDYIERETESIIEPEIRTTAQIFLRYGANWQAERMYAEADNIMRFLDTEVELKLSDTKTIERIKWYFETYFEQFKKK